MNKLNHLAFGTSVLFIIVNVFPYLIHNNFLYRSCFSFTVNFFHESHARVTREKVACGLLPSELPTPEKQEEAHTAHTND